MEKALNELAERGKSLRAREYVLRQKMFRDIVMRADVVSCSYVAPPPLFTDLQQDLYNVYLVSVFRSERDRLPSCISGRGVYGYGASIVDSADERRECLRLHALLVSECRSTSVSTSR